MNYASGRIGPEFYGWRLRKNELSIVASKMGVEQW